MNKKYSIIHDSLAKEIADKASLKTKRIRQMKAVLKQTLERNKLLDRTDLRDVKQLKSDINFTREELHLVQKSKQQLLLKNLAVALFTLLFLVVGCAFLWFKWQAKQSANRAESRRLVFIAQQELEKKNTSIALHLAHLAHQQSPNSLATKVLSDAFHQYYVGQPFLLKKIQYPTAIMQSRFLSDTTLLMLSETGQLEISNFNGVILRQIGVFKKAKSFTLSKEHLLIPNGDSLLIYDRKGGLEKLIQTATKGTITKIYADNSSNKFACITDNNQILYFQNFENLPLIFPLPFEEYVDILSVNFSKNGEKIWIVTRVNDSPVITKIYEWKISQNTYRDVDFSFYKTDEIVILEDSTWFNIDQGLLFNPFDSLRNPLLEKGLNNIKMKRQQQLIISTNSSNDVKIWNKKGDFISLLKEGDVTINGIDISEDGKQYLAQTVDNEVYIWRLMPPFFPEIKLPANLTSMDISVPNREILIALENKSIELRKFDGTLIKTFKDHTAAVNGAFFLQKNQFLSFSNDKTAVIRNSKKEEKIVLKGHKRRINFATFNKHSGKIATCSFDNSIRIWDVLGNCLDTLLHPNKIDVAAFNLTGQKLLTGCRDNIPRLWENGIAIELIVHKLSKRASILGLDISKNGNSFVTTSGDKSVVLWNKNGIPQQQFSGHSDWVTSGVFAPNGQLILTTSKDETAKLWNLDGQLLTSFIGHKDLVKGALFSNDGEFVLTYSTDGTAKLWNLKGELLANYWHKSPVVNVYFIENEWVVIASEKGVIRFWALPITILKYLEEHPLPQFSEKSNFRYGIQ